MVCNVTTKMDFLWWYQVKWLPNTRLMLVGNPQGAVDVVVHDLVTQRVRTKCFVCLCTGHLSWKFQRRVVIPPECDRCVRLSGWITSDALAAVADGGHVNFVLVTSLDDIGKQ